MSLAAIEEYLLTHPLYVNKYRPNVGVGKSQCFGIVRKRSLPPDISRQSWLHPKLHALLTSFPCPVPYTSVQVNDSLTCLPHKDKNNVGDSYIIGFGDYTGGELILHTEPEQRIDIRKGFIFNGSEITHSTAPFTGRRFSLVYHTQVGASSLDSYKVENDVLMKLGVPITKKDGIPHPLRGRTRKFEIAVPSYNRAQMFKEKTYALLKRHDLLKSTTVFVVEGQEEEYKLPGIKVVVGVKGLTNQRQFIYNYYKEGTHILQMDDDVDSIIDSKKGEEPMKQLIINGFNVAVKEGCRMWGIYPIANPFFFKNGYSTDLKFVCGPFFGLIKKGATNSIPEECSYKEDYYRTCWYYKEDKKIVRFNDVAVKTKFYKNKGGLYEGRSLDGIKKAAELVKEAFPEYVKLHTRKEREEISLRCGK